MQHVRDMQGRSRGVSSSGTFPTRLIPSESSPKQQALYERLAASHPPAQARSSPSVRELSAALTANIPSTSGGVPAVAVASPRAAEAGSPAGERDPEFRRWTTRPARARAVRAPSARRRLLAVGYECLICRGFQGENTKAREVPFCRLVLTIQ
eukprot:COSAG02_NODE_4182_length_5656_cov_2.473097_5_plen_153_part_00